MSTETIENRKGYSRICTTYFQTRCLPLPKRRWRQYTSDSLQQKCTAVQLAEKLPSFGFEEEWLHDFYHATPTGAGMFRRFTGQPLAFQHAHIDKLSEAGISINEPNVSLLLTPTVYYVLGIDLIFWTPTNLDNDYVLRILHDLALASQEQCESNLQYFAWKLTRCLDQDREWETGAPFCSASIRRAFDLIGFALHEAMQERQPIVQELERWSRTQKDSELRCNELHKLGEIFTPNVDTWGYHSEFKDFFISGSSMNWIVNPHRRISPQLLVYERLLGTHKIAKLDVAAVQYPSRDDEPNWVVGDSESIRVVTEEHDDNPKTKDARNLIEYLAYRQGVVTSIQHQIPRCSLQKTIEYKKQLAFAMDDYVLTNQNARLLQRVRTAIHRDLRIWDLEHRAEQVQRHLDRIQARFEESRSRFYAALALFIAPFSIFLVYVSSLDAQLKQSWIFWLLLALLILLAGETLRSFFRMWRTGIVGRLRSPGRDPTL